ncbi:SAM-dependent methyltransferase [Streptomyces sp. NPDC058001]|uniref:SAM-dependent methyltransferase n=1 Tax=Streptomyces sp. NPDC058001 TaxID=3346300 RepID=UPI0036E2632F
MTPTLARRPRGTTGPTSRADRHSRARDWAEIQERMLVPLYEAVYERLDVGPGTRLLGLGCGSGLALLMAAARGAPVTGVEDAEPERLALARERLAHTDNGPLGPRLVDGRPTDVRDARDPHDARDTAEGRSGQARQARQAPAYDLVTAFQPVGGAPGDSAGIGELLAEAGPLTQRGAAVVLAGWGPPERCATAAVLRVATDPLRGSGGWRPAPRDDLEEVAGRAGLTPDGSGRVACPFGYADADSAVRGLLSTGLFDAAMGATDAVQIDKELREALHPYERADGTVWMPNVFRYLIARGR